MVTDDSSPNSNSISTTQKVNTPMHGEMGYKPLCVRVGYSWLFPTYLNDEQYNRVGRAVDGRAGSDQDAGLRRDGGDGGGSGRGHGRCDVRQHAAGR